MLAFVGALVVSSVIGVAPAAANAGKVLVFTGTAGTANDANAAATTALQALGTAGDYTVDTTADATKIAAANLAGYRAVVFVNSAGDVLDAAQEADLQSYVQGGGGFVGIGETAKLEEGDAAFFDTLIGLTGASRTTAASAVSSQDVEFLDRVHPATKDLPHARQGPRPTTTTPGPRTRPARCTPSPACGSTRSRAAHRSPTTRSRASPATATTLQPQQERALSWCRDVQQGRSFYTGLGQTAASYDATLSKHLGAAIQWAAGMVRGNCKATINSNYQVTRLTPPNPTDRGRDANVWARSTASRWRRTAASSTRAAPSASRA